MTASPITAPAPATGPTERVRALAADVQLDAGILAMFAASRLLLVVAAIVAETVIRPSPALVTIDGAPILRSLTSWDGWWYLHVALDGYHAQAISAAYHDTAFAPLFPLIVRVLSAPWPAYAALTAVLLSNVLFVAALGLLARLGTPYLGRRRAALAAGLLAIYPTASVFGMAYTESLFLLCVVAAFLCAERRHRAWAGIFLAFAVLARLQGVALVLPLWVLMLRQDGWRPRPSHGWLLLGPLALLGFVLYVASITGSLTGYLDSAQGWGRTGLASAPTDETVGARFGAYEAALLLILLWSVFLLIFRRVDRLRLEYVLVPVVFILALVVSGRIESVGRITLAFPYVWILANRRSVIVRRGWPVLSAGLFTVIAILSFAGYWVP